MERTPDGATQQATQLIDQLNALAIGQPAPLQREIKTVVHKLAYPMSDILLKVPGQTVSNRAKKLGVSRQTIYVWASEKFRPTRVQAKRIARVTGVPIEHILDNGWEADGDARRKARKKAARVATRRAKNAKRDRSAAPKRRRTDRPRKDAQSA